MILIHAGVRGLATWTVFEYVTLHLLVWQLFTPPPTLLLLLDQEWSKVCFHRVLWGFLVLLISMKGVAKGLVTVLTVLFTCLCIPHSTCPFFLLPLPLSWVPLAFYGGLFFAVFGSVRKADRSLWTHSHLLCLIPFIPRCLSPDSVIYHPGPASNWLLWFLASLMISLTSHHSLYWTHPFAACKIWPPFPLFSLPKKAVKHEYCYALRPSFPWMGEESFLWSSWIST